MCDGLVTFLRSKEIKMDSLADAIVFQSKFQNSPVHVMQGNRKGFLLDNVSHLIDLSSIAREKLTRILINDAWRL